MEQAPSIRMDAELDQDALVELPRSGKRPLFFTRYRHDGMKAGMISPVGMSDVALCSVELRPLQQTDVFKNGRHLTRPETEGGALAIYDLRDEWAADLQNPFDNINFVIPLSSFREFANERNQRFSELRFDIKQTRIDPVMMHLALAAAPALARPGEIDTLYLESIFLAARDYLATNYGDFGAAHTREPTSISDRQLQMALEFIEDNLTRDMGLADIAEACGASVSSLGRGFRHAVGASPYKWVLRRRIALAQRLIRLGADSLSDVALACGFADQSHMSRVFVKHVGVTPAAWRRTITS